MKKSTELIVSVGLLLLVATTAVAAGWSRAELAMVRESVAANARVDSLMRELDRMRDSVRVDSIEVPRYVDRWSRIRDSLVDTLYLSDTVTVIVEAADRAVRTCTDALGRCNRALSIADSLLAAERAAHEVTRSLLALSQSSLSRSQSRTWRYRAEGAAACALGAVTLNRWK